MYGIEIHHMWLLVLVAAVAQWILGALWYGVIFRKSWKALVGATGGGKPASAAFSWITSFVACLLLCYVLVHVVAWAAAMNFTGGAKIGVICWVGFMAPPLFAQHICEGRRANLFAINAGYWLLAMALGGGILAAFH